jgi:hypothetical protein
MSHTHVTGNDEIHEPQPKQAPRQFHQSKPNLSGNLPSIGTLPLPPIFEGESLLSTNEQNWMNEFFDILSANPESTSPHSSGNLPIFTPPVDLLHNSLTPPIQPGIIHSPMQGFTNFQPTVNHLVIPHDMNQGEHFAIHSLHKLSRSTSPRMMSNKVELMDIKQESPTPFSNAFSIVETPLHIAKPQPLKPQLIQSLQVNETLSIRSNSTHSQSVISSHSNSRSASPQEKKRKKKETHDSKRQNHILSEQKRRLAIRTGFENIASIVPGLKLSKSSTGAGGTSKSVILLRTAEYLDWLQEGIDVLKERGDALHTELGRELELPESPVPIHLQNTQE